MFPEGFFAAAGEAIILMLIAAILAGIIVYLLMRSRYQALQGRYDSMAGKYSDLDNRYKALQGQYDGMQAKYQALENDLEQKNKDLAACKQARLELEKKISAMPVPVPHDDSALKAELATKAEALQACEARQNGLQAKIEGLETALTAAEAKSAQVEADAKTRPIPVVDAAAAAVPKQKPSKEEKEAATLARIQERASEINFDRIGLATAADKDNLQLVKGIGPFIERKLNSIGIYTFRQIANFTPEDEDKVNEVIEFFPGRIRRDNWSSQSEDFAKEKEDKKDQA
ncbi:MAG: hypothetical protein AAF399_12710 [Bacteroidota bacterium]